MTSLAFRVIGIPEQAGSKRAFVPKGWTRPIITDTNKNLKTWQQLVATCAHTALMSVPDEERGQFQDGVRLQVWFYLPRPKSLPARVLAHTKHPDLDKLVRAICDGMTGVVYRDDAQIVDLEASKHYAVDVPYVDVLVSVAMRAPAPRLVDDHDDLFTVMREEIASGQTTQHERPIAAAARTNGGSARHGRARHSGTRSGGDRLRRHP